MNFLVDLLFSHRKKLTKKAKFKRIIAATVMRFHDAFLGIVGNKPSGKYKDPTHNPFYHKIISVFVETHISMETLRQWQDEFIAGFNKKNSWQLTFQKLAKVLQKRMLLVVALLG